MDSISKNKVISGAKISDDLGKREEYLKKWRSSFKDICWMTLILMIACMMLGVILERVGLFRSRTNEIYYLNTLLGVWVIAVIYIYYKKFSLKRKLGTSNAPLMCFESEIIKIYRVRRRRQLTNLYYIVLKENIELRINLITYYRFVKESVKSVRVYFFEEELDKYNKYFVEGSTENLIEDFNFSDYVRNMIESDPNSIDNYIEYEQKNNMTENDSYPTSITDIKKNFISRIIDNSQVSNELSIRNILLKRSSKRQKSDTMYTVCALIVFFTSLLIPYGMYRNGSGITLAIICFAIVCLPILLWCVNSFNKINDLNREQQYSMMCFESDILKTYRKKVEGYRGSWYLQSYIILKNNTLFTISDEQFEKIENSNFKHIKIYFLESVLRKYNRDMRILENPNITFVEFF